jgi:hypothetical protein
MSDGGGSLILECGVNRSICFVVFFAEPILAP